jgi:hypothetical protein
VPLNPSVEAEVRERFPRAFVPAVLAELDAAVIPLGLTAAPSERPRIQLAIVKLAAGDLARFHAAIAAAKQDWRDVLVAAGLANAEWRDELRAA